MKTASKSSHAQSASRFRYGALALATIVLGLIVHARGSALGPTVRDILGDALWAAMIYWLAGLFGPRASISRRAAASLAFCFLIEFSQLWHTPGLDTLRRTLPGHLVLGSGFDARDLLAYAGGVFMAMLIEIAVLRVKGNP